MFTLFLFDIHFPCLGLLLPYRYMLILSRFKQSLPIFSSLFGTLPYNLPWPIQIDSISSTQRLLGFTWVPAYCTGAWKFFFLLTITRVKYIAHLIWFLSATDHYPTMSNVWKSLFHIFFVQIFSCVWWEGKCGSSYSITIRNPVFYFFTAVIINLLEEEDKLTAL